MTSSSAIFDRNWDDDSGIEPIRPLFTVDDLDDDTKVLAWMNRCYDTELKRAAKYREMALKHIALYRGRHYANRGRGGGAEGSLNGLGIASNKVSRLIINYLYDGVQQRVSRVTRNKATVAITPANSEYSDRVSAKVTKYWVDYQLYQNDMDALAVQIANAAYIIGESYPCVLWNPSKGATHPDWQKEAASAKQEKRKPRLPLKDSDGNQVLGEDGEPLWITRPVKIGDVEFSCRTPLNALPEYCGDFDKRKYDILEDWVDVDELRAKYPDLAEKIKTDQDYHDPLGELRQFAGQPPIDKNKVLVRTFFHRSTDFLDDGRFIVSTKDVILENKPLESPDQELPLARLTDIDIVGEQRGLSFFVHSKALQATLNDFVSMIRKNTLLGAHPKWLLPKGSVVKKDALGNDITSIEYTGPTEPRMVSPPPLSQEVNLLRKDLRDDLTRIQGISDFMQGKVPPNIRSAMALQMIDEQDEQRANSGVTKFNKMIRDTVHKAINLASCYYEKEDKRLIPIVGRDNSYLLKQFDPEALSKPYNIRVANSSGLPNGKAAKTEMLIELKKSFPALVRDEQVADMLEFSETERFYDQASVASRAAEAENESMLNGDPVDQPVPFENHIVHWTSHMAKIQDRGFKVATPPEVQAALIGHTQATEFLMLKTARKNPAYSLELVALPGFPAFFNLGPVERMILDRARSGNPLSLEELAMLDETETLPPSSGAGITPPPGGIPNPSQNVGAPISPAVANQAPMPPGPPQAQPPAEMAPVAE